MNGTIATDCTCPSGNGSLRHPCPAHPFVPAITHEQAIKLARAAAYSHCRQHSYLPQTWEAAATWQPHEWVVSAIVVASDTTAPADTWFADQLTAMGEVIPLATTPSTRGIDPADPWRGLYAPELMPKLDGVNDWIAAHPDLPQWPDDEERGVDNLIKAQGFAYTVVGDEYPDEDESVELDPCEWLANWKPAPPAGEHWRLVMVQDTEDGPAAVYVRPLALIDASPKGGSTDENNDLLPELRDVEDYFASVGPNPIHLATVRQAISVIVGSPKGGSTEAKDAARYRWLRDRYDPSVHDGECDSFMDLEGANMDAAIDDELQATSAEVGA